ncbi:MAG: hypothetical protein H6807_15775 [Planctomycetes bacterium]|nr:hypothetical protein [Planctomycetota bacterium]
MATTARLTRSLLIALLLAALAPAQAGTTESCLELLKSNSAADLATAGHQAAEKGLKPVAEKIAELLGGAIETREVDQERAYAFRAFADALFMNKVAIDSPRLARLRAEFAPIRMCVAVASLDPARAEDWLLGQLAEPIDWEVYQVVVGLLASKPSPRFGLWLLTEAEPVIEVIMEGPNAGLGGYRGGRKTARRWKEVIAPAGFPRSIDYGMPTELCIDCWPLGIDGPGASHVHRAPLGMVQHESRPAASWWERPLMLRGVLDRYSGLPMSAELAAELRLRFPGDTKPSEVQARVQLGREALAALYWERVAKMVENGLLEAAEARKLKPAFALKISDWREKGAAKLWKMDRPLARPDWLRKLK